MTSALLQSVINTNVQLYCFLSICFAFVNVKLCVILNGSVQFSSVPWLIGSSGEHKWWLSRDPLPVFSAGGPCKHFWHGQISPLFDAVHQAFPLPTTALPTLHPWRTVLEMLSWCVTCPNHASFCLLIVARRGSCGPMRKLILLHTQSLVWCS